MIQRRMMHPSSGNNSAGGNSTLPASSKATTTVGRWATILKESRKPWEKKIQQCRLLLSIAPSGSTKKRTFHNNKNKKRSSLTLVTCLSLFLVASYLAWTAHRDLVQAVKAVASPGSSGGSSSMNAKEQAALIKRLLKSSPPNLKGVKGVQKLKDNTLYVLPERHPQVGDRSDKYALLRQEYDALLPLNPKRSLDVVHQLRQRNSKGGDKTIYSLQPMTTMSSEKQQPESYDIYNCPDTPPEHYPYAWSLAKEILPSWPPRDTTTVKERSIYQGICVFEYAHDLKKAQTYKDHEVPFVLQGDPHIARTVERWHMPGYLERMLNAKTGRQEQQPPSQLNQVHRTEYSPTNQFLYRAPGTPDTTGSGTVLKWLTYKEWLAHANQTAGEHGENEEDDGANPDQEHWYYRLLACGAGMGNRGTCDTGSSEYLFDELPFFQPTHEWPPTTAATTSTPSLENRNMQVDLDVTTDTVLPVSHSTHLLMGDHGEYQHGLHCRFGMRGVIAENHFDSTRNAIVLLGGSRRYILASPTECKNMELYPVGHPSARHSNFDWSTGDTNSFPESFRDHAMGNEVVLQAGEALYLPTYWFHQITSLELNFQCNTRSGYEDKDEDSIQTCGFS